jgi:hypothetical protein
MRIAGQALDPSTTHASDWVGNSMGGREATLGGTGNLIVGVFGCQDEHDVRALGLLYVAGPAPAAPSRALPPTGSKPSRPPAGAAAPAVQELPPVPEAAAPEEPAVQPEPRPAKQHAESSGALIWLPFLAFGGVFILFAAALVMVSGRKGKRAAPAPGKKEGPLPPRARRAGRSPRPRRLSRRLPWPTRKPRPLAARVSRQLAGRRRRLPASRLRPSSRPPPSHNRKLLCWKARRFRRP